MDPRQAFKSSVNKARKYYKTASIMEIMMGLSLFIIFLTIIVGFSSTGSGEVSGLIGTAVVSGIFGFIASITWLVRLVMLILGIVAISEAKNLAIMNKEALPVDPFVPGLLAFFLIIAVYFAWGQSNKLWKMLNEAEKVN